MAAPFSSLFSVDPAATLLTRAATRPWCANRQAFNRRISSTPTMRICGHNTRTGDPKKFHWDLMKINRLLFMPENLNWRRPLRSPQKQVGRQ